MVKQDALMESLSSNLHGEKPGEKPKNRGQSPIILERLDLKQANLVELR